ncbi:MAG: hypothetical protein H0V17_17820 [Deltaproteobacteria bacterium]|nr:hypothetical protein [Deltaproteobacteria bacterium]
MNGDCATDCTLGPCAEGFYCQDTGACLQRCTSVDDPICNGYVCDVDVGECEPYCLAGELACATGYVCDQTTCVPRR